MKIENRFKSGIHSDIQINVANKKINLECKITFPNPPLCHCRSMAYIVRLNIKNINKPKHKIDFQKMCYIYLEGIKLPLKLNYKKIQNEIYEVIEPCVVVDKKIIKSCFIFIKTLTNDSFIFKHILLNVCKTGLLQYRDLQILTKVCMESDKCGK